MQLSERRDARRLAVAVLAAVLVHVGLYFGIPFLTSLDTGPLPDYGPIVVTLEEPAAFEPPPPEPAPAPRPAPAPEPAQRPAPSPSPAPARAATPAAPASTPARAPGTSAFRQAGAATGTSAGAAPESIVSGPPPVTLPAVGSTTPGSGEQRSGEALLLSGKPPAGSGGSLDTGRLDAALARAGTTGGTGAAAASGARPAVVTADIAWDVPGKGRNPYANPEPVWPESVKQLGLDLELTVAITVDAAGLVSSAVVVRSSGYTDVDKACLDAVRRVRFPPEADAAPIKGVWLLRVRPH